MKKLHLISNAHLDPVWLWEWEEGAAEAISTFRVAADFCEQYDGYVFNHNEVILYEWVEQYEPQLFERIRRLVKEGKWHIMGGWYLQPDCNMPSGESFVRQIMSGRRYFAEKFGVAPTTAINFDPAEEFRWIGYDGSAITGHRAFGHYSSSRGGAAKKAKDWLNSHPERTEGLLLWGIGNHGGGPSRIDMDMLAELTAETKDVRIVHSTPEAYFREVHGQRAELPEYRGDLNLWAPGCYTSQIRIKQRHRLLENELFMAEKIWSHVSVLSGLPYPKRELDEAQRDLMMSEFHDILPGSSIQAVEETSLRLLDHGLETMSRIKARGFFALARGERKPAGAEIPVFIYNPHPYPVSGVFECEFQLPDPNYEDGTYTKMDVAREGEYVPSQLEKEASNLNLDWRKRIIIAAELNPQSMNRFDCIPEKIKAEKPIPAMVVDGDILRFANGLLSAEINRTTGLLDRYAINGVDYLRAGAFQPLVIRDNADPWGSKVSEFRDVIGEFRLLDPARAARLSGVKEPGALENVRVIEDGCVRAVVEAFFGYGDSFICFTYKLPKRGTEIEIDLRVFWLEKDTMLKLSLPTLAGAGSRYLGQVAYGTAELPVAGRETVAQQWVAAVDGDTDRVVTVINEGTYGSDYKYGEIRMSLLRSPAYSALPIGKRPLIVSDRFVPRSDQGERSFRFWLNAGSGVDRLPNIGREAQAKNEKPFALSFFPSGDGEELKPLLLVGDPAVLLTACKQAESGEGWIFRLFEPTGCSRAFEVELPAFGVKERIALQPFEIKTLKWSKKDGLRETGLLEQDNDAGEE
ncbi:alpha-mannosidase [Paenibacillus hemerocallicola]|uniref:Alpha-mannosidase n=1 Tax=Paenibacillus hemerocallicola TaxID=1172614 RepID=A0A5C4T296_9BACL|nr:alpha-mannosidase [Paenibacillus hemerocallicola]TNJ63133.1 alpha-mannosidase [Paenibacillus hemerocallicola]